MTILASLGDIWPIPSFMTSPVGDLRSSSISLIWCFSNTTVGVVLLRPKIGSMDEPKSLKEC